MDTTTETHGASANFISVAALSSDAVVADAVMAAVAAAPGPAGATCALRSSPSLPSGRCTATR